MMNSTAGVAEEAEALPSSRDILEMLRASGPMSRAALLAKLGGPPVKMASRIQWLFAQGAVCLSASGMIALPGQVAPLDRLTDSEAEEEGRRLWQRYGILVISADMAPDARSREFLHLLGRQLYGRRTSPRRDAQ